MATKRIYGFMLPLSHRNCNITRIVIQHDAKRSIIAGGWILSSVLYAGNHNGL